MLHCLNTSGNLGANCSDMTVLERQRARMKWQQQQQNHFSANGVFSSSSSSSSSSCLQLQNSPSRHGSMMMTTDSSGSSLADVVAHHSIKPDPAGGLENGWPKLDKFVMGFGSCSGLPPAAPAPVQPADSGIDVMMNSAISRTSSCPPVLAEAKGSKKRKADMMNTKVVAENDNNDKRIKVGADDGESKITGQTTNKSIAETNCADTSKEKSKPSEAQKPDYIHVRARRGQATDSHSLAERVRREKISERMKYLQDLVPGCNKITGKAGMLDEIINYVQSLQRQVEFLSMKLAAVNPRLDFNIDDLYAKELYPACSAASFQAIGMSQDMANPASYLQFNSAQQIVSGCGLDAAGMNPSDMGLRRTISAPVSMPETFVDSSCFTQILPCSTWEGDFQNLYNVAFDQARAPPSFPSQLFTGLIEPTNLKVEMEM